MLRLGEVKLELDQAVAGEEPEEEENSAPAKAMKASLLSVLRKQFEQEGESQVRAESTTVKVDIDVSKAEVS